MEELRGKGVGFCSCSCGMQDPEIVSRLSTRGDALYCLRPRSFKLGWSRLCRNAGVNANANANANAKANASWVRC